MNRKDKTLLAMSGFMGGIGFIVIGFHFNHKDILNRLHIGVGVDLLSTAPNKQ